MSPSPRWCTPGPAPLASAIAAAAHHAWQGPAEGGSNRFLDAFRNQVGPERAATHEMAALRIFLAEPTPPEGYDVPPASTQFSMCPRCSTIRKTPHHAPQHGRVKLLALRDAEWLSSRFATGNTRTIAKQLGCSVELVVYWAEKHGILTPKMQRAADYDERVATLHRKGRGPGGIARELGESRPDHVRQSLHRQKLANRKSGQVYHVAEWWTERMRVQGWTKTKCAREAGIAPHAATMFVKRFGLSDLTANAKKPKKYPVLTSAISLLELLKRHHDNYEAVAKEVGCNPGLVSQYARKLLGRDRKHRNKVPHGAREWWVTRIERGVIVPEMAREADIKVGTAWERIRRFGLTARAYENETRREQRRRA